MPLALQDILNLPGNQAAFDVLREVVSKGSATAFIGAGASVPLYPSWADLMGRLAGEPLRRGLVDESSTQYWRRNAEAKPLQVASQIRQAMGDSFYYSFLQETFKRRTGIDGRSFTETQALLMALNFKAYITTNYDPSLLEARFAIRPHGPDTSFIVWNQPDRVNAWDSGDLFQNATTAPVLFAHGYCDDPPSIVLDHTSYRRAYHDTPYRRLFENLWSQQHLVFVGFGFRDIVLEQIADEVLWQTARQSSQVPRHIALIGLAPDEPYTAAMRAEFQTRFNASPLFYPVELTPDRRHDHSALRTILRALPPYSRPVFASETRLAPAVSSAEIAKAFIHDTTEDETFTGRIDALRRLDLWAADSKVRIVAVTALGGLGKTALVGKWIKGTSATVPRGFEGIFFWSFYRHRETTAFFEALLQFGQSVFGWVSKNKTAAARKRASELLHIKRLIVVIDGLEVIQEAQGAAYGSLLEPDLAEFLHFHARSVCSSLVVLTSRFPFPDLARYLGCALHLMTLEGLSLTDGVELLWRLGVRGALVERQRVSHQLEGHPLALHLFARSLPAESAGDPSFQCNLIFDHEHLRPDDPLEAKILRLLRFYDQTLDSNRRHALQLLALFRFPVDEVTLRPLWTKLLRQPAISLSAALTRLQSEHLLSEVPAPSGNPKFTCHAVLREHFRKQFLKRGFASTEVAGFLVGPPEGEVSEKDIPAIEVALGVLIEAGEMKPAHDIYNSRFDDGRIFFRLGAPQLGLLISRAFVADPQRCQRVEASLSPELLNRYLSAVAVFAHFAGEQDIAFAYHEMTLSRCARANSAAGMSISLRNLARTEVSVGRLASAAAHLEEALGHAIQAGRPDLEAFALADLAYAESLRGKVADADRHFERANRLEHTESGSKRHLHSLRGIRWASHLLRVGRIEDAALVCNENLTICQNNRREDQAAMCRALLGLVHVLKGQWTEAEAQCAKARSRLFSGQMIHDLCGVYLIDAACAVRRDRIEEAAALCDQVLDLAGPRNYRIVHSDVLNLRSVIAARRGDPGAARDGAEEAMNLARSCEYAWGQMEACRLLSSAYGGLGLPEDCARWRNEFDYWERTLKPAEL